LAWQGACPALVRRVIGRSWRRDGLEVGFDAGGGVAGVGAGDAGAEVSFDPGEGGVSEPVGGDALRSDPGEGLADAVPEVAVAAEGDCGAVPETNTIHVSSDREGPSVIPDDIPEGQIDGLPLDVILAVDGRALRQDLVARLRKPLHFGRIGRPLKGFPGPPALRGQRSRLSKRP
jgi:hypothetical protein